ncbi:hypothetical protein SPRG_18582, partial [Saprolegnia parasitica CBS 223.65]
RGSAGQPRRRRCRDRRCARRRVLLQRVREPGVPVPVAALGDLGCARPCFCNAGSLMSWDRVLDERAWMKNLLSETRAAAGVGVVMGTRFGRFEANYSWVLKSLAGDRVKRAQLGLGLHFI